MEPPSFPIKCFLFNYIIFLFWRAEKAEMLIVDDLSFVLLCGDGWGHALTNHKSRQHAHVLVRGEWNGTAPSKAGKDGKKEGAATRATGNL
jgi:hypothetical protein